LNSGEWVRLFLLIASLQSVTLILREALIFVQYLSSHWGPSLFTHSALAHCTTKNVLYPYTLFCSFVHLFFCVTRLPNCACFSISASNSPKSAASRTLRSVSATSASLPSSIAFLPLANSKGLFP
jgi:hypothetical protein